MGIGGWREWMMIEEERVVSVLSMFCCALVHPKAVGS